MEQPAPPRKTSWKDKLAEEYKRLMEKDAALKSRDKIFSEHDVQILKDLKISPK